MPIDPSIALNVQGIQTPDVLGSMQKAGNIRDMALRNQIGQMQLQQSQREQAADAKTRELLSQNDPMDPQGQQKIYQGLQESGFGDRALKFRSDIATQQIARQQAQENTAKTLAEINAKTAETNATLTKSKNEWLSQHASLIKGVQDPEQRAAAWGNFLDQAKANHFDVSDMPQQPPDDKILTKMERINMAPADRAKLEYEEGQRNGWADIKPALDRIMTPANPAKGWNPLTGEKGAALSRAMAAIPPNLSDSPQVKEWVTAQKGEPQQTVFNPASQAMTAPASKGLIAGLAEKYANREIDPAGIQSALAGIRGPNRAQALNDVFDQAKKLNPSVNLTQDKAAVIQLDNAANQRTLGIVNNFASNLDKLDALSQKVARSGSPLMNAGILKAKGILGDQDVALFEQMKSLMSEEGAQVFGTSGGGATDAKIKLANDVLGGNLSIPAFHKAVMELKDFANTRRNSIKGTMGAYAPKDAQASPTIQPHPQDSDAVAWAKANPTDPRSAKILQLNGVK